MAGLENQPGHFFYCDSPKSRSRVRKDIGHPRGDKPQAGNAAAVGTSRLAQIEHLFAMRQHGHTTHIPEHMEPDSGLRRAPMGSECVTNTGSIATDASVGPRTSPAA